MFTPYRTKNESLLDYAARLILLERDNLVDSAPRGILFRLEAISRELQQIEDRL